VVGIIGRNGAGKSTLLKILSRITEPTSGRAEIYGRVSSLLEVGTGFHSELTGRENIYLNGTILGMRKTEIDHKFDEIVDFSEVERFIDTPVKRYSSGMRVRLAFSVAAHLEPEILLVDEVLAVGDAEFQKKCLGKMEDVAKEGRTVLFVSHNMATISALCERAIYIQNGGILEDNKSELTIHKYLESIKTINSADLINRKDRVGSGEIRFTSCKFINSKKREVTMIEMGEELIIEGSFTCKRPVREPAFGFLLADDYDRIVIRAYSHESYSGSMPSIVNSGKVRCIFNRMPLMYGSYSLHLWISRRGDPIDYIQNAAKLEITRYDVYGTGRPPDKNNGGDCFANHSWKVCYNEK
jgi:lipopolysaccharide transport system ATP-binding protein